MHFAKHCPRTILIIIMAGMAVYNDHLNILMMSIVGLTYHNTVKYIHGRELIRFLPEITDTFFANSIIHIMYSQNSVFS